MNILVTGAHGFVGKHVLNALKSTPHIVFAPKRSEVDILNFCQLEKYVADNKIDAVIHLAALCGGIGINKDNPGLFIFQNLQMGINVLEVARIHSLKVVNLGTVCSYPKFAPIPFKEEDIWNGYPEETNAPYGIAKKTIVEMGIAYHRQYGLNVTNLIPVNMAGEYDHFDLYSSHVLPAIIRKFAEAQETGNPVQLWGTGKASREILYAGDCANAIVKSLDINTGPEPINLGTGKEITIKELVRLTQIVCNYSSEVIWDESKPDGQPRRCLDTFTASRVLNWKAKTPVHEIIARTNKYYHDNK